MMLLGYQFESEFWLKETLVIRNIAQVFILLFISLIITG